MASNKENQSPEREKDLVNFDSFSVVQFKKYLRDHGEYVSGAKEDLLKRAKGTRLLGKKLLSEIRINDAKDTERQSLKRFVSPLGEKLSNLNDLKTGWVKPVKIPEFTYNGLYNYLVLSKRRTIDFEKNKAKRQLKAKVFYEDRHVHSLAYHDICADNSHCYVKARVIPSLPVQTEKQRPDYTVWISMAKLSGRVHAAGCDCSAGEGESCNHVAALLYALVDMSEKKKEGLDASTSKECKWNHPRKRKQSPKKCEKMTFKRFQCSELETPKKSKETGNSKPTPVNLETFEKLLRVHAPNAAWLQSREGTPTNITCTSLAALHETEFNYSDSCDIQSEQCCMFFNAYFQARKVTPEDCILIEKGTRGQYKNKKRHKARQNRITASVFGSICKRNKGKFPLSLIKSVCGYCSFDSKSVKWGRDHEPAARMKYTKSKQRILKNLQVSQCGLCVNSEYPTLGA